jgi:P-type Cu+ transporter
MPSTDTIELPLKGSAASSTKTTCYHCGTPCAPGTLRIEDKDFCCEGCKLVFEILNENGLCNYYEIQSHPGLTRINPVRKEKFTYLDNEEIASKLYKFTDGNHTIITFYLPNVHCSSCMWLLEHLNRINPGVTESRLNFTAKEVTIHFLREKISTRRLVELLSMIGYEPYISLDDAEKKKAKTYDRSKIYKLGVAGFCFGNIMMMSFPEYLSLSNGIEAKYAHLFRYFNLLLSLPVFFYSSTEFFVTAWKGLRQKVLNIDAPIALAILTTFGRSVYEILSNTGGGYLDSMSGIVFFMIVGRVIQERTYRSISFHRDYKSYFPIAVNVVTSEGVVSRTLQDLKEKDVVQLHHDEIIPADSILVSGEARIDYSFVTGETDPVSVKIGQQLYAGGKQTGETIRLQVIKPVAGSYLTSLWNHYAFSKNKSEQNDENSIFHVLSRNFTWVLLTLTLFTSIYWAFHDSSKIVNVASAMLIVACPCALLLCVTFTNGALLRILSNNGLFLRDATVIEQLSNIDAIVFDKTGTVTTGHNNVVTSGYMPTEAEKAALYQVVSHSSHPYSKAIAEWTGVHDTVTVTGWHEYTGKGLEATYGQQEIRVGSAEFTGAEKAGMDKAPVYARIGDNFVAFHVQASFREAVPAMIPRLGEKYGLTLLSGDNDAQRESLEKVFGNSTEMVFGQKPVDKLEYIERMQQGGRKVMMIGDGLNDAGALQQSNVGITLADDVNNFTPSCDAILDAGRFSNFPALMRMARASKAIINASFIVSIIYNIIALSFAMRGLLKPMNAAIIMPCSTLSIVIISTGVSNLLARIIGLTLKQQD